VLCFAVHGCRWEWFLVRLQDNSSVIVVVVVVDSACDGVINRTSGADVCAGAAE
jgi:hypothetical protein